MKLASYVADGRASFGALVGDSLVDLPGRFGNRVSTLRELIEADGLGQVANAIDGAVPDYRLADVQLLPVIPNPDKILCAGVNYRSHAAETGREVTSRPSIFLRMTNTLLGDGAIMRRPPVSECFDFEGELALVIGRGGRYIKAADALAHVAGYTCFNDGSIRDYQKFSVTSGKNFPASGPLGPFLVTTDEIPDPSRLSLTTRLNGQQVQHSETDLLIYSVPEIIAFCSEFTELLPGDVIATGTPEGVGHKRKPPLWMKPGDMIEVEISGVGTLRNRIEDEG